MKNCTLFVATCFFTLLPLHIMAAGPQLTAARFGVATGDLKNAVTSSAGDVNNDNYDDILIGAPFYDPVVDGKKQKNAGGIWVISGSNGDVLFETTGTHSNDHFGAATTYLGDINSDGYPDYAVGAPGVDSSSKEAGAIRDAGMVEIYSGKLHSVIRRHYGESQGDHLGSTLDGGSYYVNADAIPDYLVAADSWDYVSGDLRIRNVGRVAVIDGANGNIIWEKLGDESGKSGFGKSVALVGDVNFDSHDDFVVGAPLFDNPSPRAKDAGALYLYSGKDGVALLSNHYGSKARNHVGASVADMGDIDSDGYSEIAYGVPGNGEGAMKNSGSVYVYSHHASMTWQYGNGLRKGDAFGRSIHSAGDVNVDGKPDLMIGAPFYDDGAKKDSGAIFIMAESGNLSNGSTRVLTGSFAGDKLGSIVNIGGDINNDANSDLITTAPGMDIYDAGKLVTKNAGGILGYRINSLSVFTTP